jgi:hypothetical protein
MRRDWNLIRLLLLEVESGSQPAGLSDYTEPQVLYHAVLLVESELVHGSVTTDQTGMPIEVSLSRLTWKGHDFLDATRDEATWKKAVSLVQTSFGSATAELLKDACKQLLTSTLEAAIRASKGP